MQERQLGKEWKQPHQRPQQMKTRQAKIGLLVFLLVNDMVLYVGK